jgi:glycosyltransferase involved in cell wall biosynthesis
MRVSIIINNYNYGRFLREATDSALEQSHPDKEVIVVDDGSTDNSHDIIAEYGNRIVPVLKLNGGQASAFNAGYRVASGDVIVFLDADDRLDSNAVSEVVGHFVDTRLTKVQWLLRLVDEAGHPLGGTRPASPPPDGDLRDHIIVQGPSSCPSSPTSGSAWSRAFLEEVLPAPEDVYRICADEYLFNLAPIFGGILTIPHALGDYRLHSASWYSAKPFLERLQMEIEHHRQQCKALAAVLLRYGVKVDLDSWRRYSWFDRLKIAIDKINHRIPEEERFLLVDGNTWGAHEIFGGRALPVMEHDGQPWGDPADTKTLLDELERQRRHGVRFLVLAWPAFWWLDYYEGLRAALTSQATCIAQDNLLAMYELSPIEQASTGSSGTNQQPKNPS